MPDKKEKRRRRRRGKERGRKRQSGFRHSVFKTLILTLVDVYYGYINFVMGIITFLGFTLLFCQIKTKMLLTEN